MIISEITSSEWGLSLEGQGLIVQGNDDIKQCISIILFTRKGSDPLRPEFGCGALDKIDLPVNSAIVQMVPDIISSLELFEPRIELIKLTPILSADNPGAITFSIKYKIKNTVLTDETDIVYGIR